MSAKTLSKKALAELYAPLAASITVATEALSVAEEAVTLTRVALGRTVGAAVAALTTAGASVEEAQASIMDTIHAVMSVVEWDTVQGWVRAATVADSLPEALRDTFSTEALVTLGRVKPDERNEFAEVCHAEGITGVRALREAVNAHNSANTDSRAGKRNVTQAADIVKVAEKYLSGNALPEKGDEDREKALVLLGFALGKKCPSFRLAAVVSGVEEVLYDGPIGEDEDENEK
jgi:hypothetical protein